MGAIHQPQPVKLFVGILTSVPALLPQVDEAMAARFGPVDLRSRLYPFDFTRYYEAEMGSPLLRQFLAFERLVSPDSLAAAKRFTNEIEQSFSPLAAAPRRPVNLDPGYLEQAKIVLASTKNFSHRIYLGDGIFGEVTLCYQDRQWRSFPWTFPDYRSARYDEYFHALRQIYRGQLDQSRERSKRECP